MLGYMAVSFVAEMIFGLFASFIAAWFSRQREYRADAGGAALAGREKMISALQALQRVSNPEGLPDQMAAFGILGGHGSLIQKLASTHPPLEERIASLRAAA
jgi:heat shock protein HtpX